MVVMMIIITTITSSYFWMWSSAWAATYILARVCLLCSLMLPWCNCCSHYFALSCSCLFSKQNVSWSDVASCYYGSYWTKWIANGWPRNYLSENYKRIALKLPRGCLEMASGLVKSLILFILETSGLQAHFQGLASSALLKTTLKSRFCQFYIHLASKASFSGSGQLQN